MVMKTVINIKADKEVKEKAVKTAKEMGLPLSVVVNSFLKQFIVEKKVTFSIPFRPSRWLQKILIEAEENFRKSKNIEGPFYTAEEFMKGLK